MAMVSETSSALVGGGCAPGRSMLKVTENSAFCDRTSTTTSASGGDHVLARLVDLHHALVAEAGQGPPSDGESDVRGGDRGGMSVQVEELPGLRYPGGGAEDGHRHQQVALPE